MKTSVLLICLFALPFAFTDLQVGFYKSSSPQAESFVKKVVKKIFNRDKSITADLLHLHFHECFASIPQLDKRTEKDSNANRGVVGFDLIDEVNESLEAACPSTVSCADIITLTARDVVALSRGPIYHVPTGRRDGLVSDSDESDDN